MPELRHKEVSHSWLTHLDTRAGSVLPAGDFVVNVQKRLDNRIFTGEAQCRLCGEYLDARLEHSVPSLQASASQTQQSPQNLGD